MNTITIKPWVLVQNAGDGSAYPRFFNTEEACMKAYRADPEAFSEDPCPETLVIDLDTGLLVNAEDCD